MMLTPHAKRFKCDAWISKDAQFQAGEIIIPSDI
jgi:hypothetical protein